MAKGWMSKDPSEMTARQQRRMQFLEKRGRGGQVSGQPTEMPEMTARQKRRQQYVQRRDARRQRAVEDYRAQQAGQQMASNLFRSDNPQVPNFNEMKMLDTGNTASLAWQMTPEQAEQARTMFTGGFDGLGRPSGVGIPHMGGWDGTKFNSRNTEIIDNFAGRSNSLPPGHFRSDNPQDPNIYSQSPDGSIVGTYMGYPGMGAGGPTFNKRLEYPDQARMLSSSGFGGQGYGNMLGQLPAGQTQRQAVGAAMGQRGVNAARPYGTNHWSYNRR